MNSAWLCAVLCLLCLCFVDAIDTEAAQSRTEGRREGSTGIFDSLANSLFAGIGAHMNLGKIGPLNFNFFSGVSLSNMLRDWKNTPGRTLQGGLELGLHKVNVEDEKFVFRCFRQPWRFDRLLVDDLDAMRFYIGDMDTMEQWGKGKGKHDNNIHSTSYENFKLGGQAGKCAWIHNTNKFKNVDVDYSLSEALDGTFPADEYPKVNELVRRSENKEDIESLAAEQSTA